MVFVWSRQIVSYVPCNKPPPTIFDIQCHSRADAVCAELDSFFIQHWPFKSQEERNRFLNSQTNGFACWALPLADDDRLLDTVKVNTLLFLLDDVAEDMRLSCLQKHHGTAQRSTRARSHRSSAGP